MRKLNEIIQMIKNGVKRFTANIMKNPTEQEKKERRLKEKRFWRRFDKSMKCISRSIWSIFLMGLLLHVAEYFWPELPEHIPVIYGLYDHLMQILEFILWGTLKGLQAIFEGNFFKFAREDFWPTVKQGIGNFIEWVESL